MCTKLSDADFNLSWAVNPSQEETVSSPQPGPHKHGVVCFTALCHVYITMNSFLSMRVHAGVTAQELLQAVAERMDVPQGDLLLVAVTYPGGENTHNPQHSSTSASVDLRLCAHSPEIASTFSAVTRFAPLQVGFFCSLRIESSLTASFQ